MYKPSPYRPKKRLSGTVKLTLLLVGGVAAYIAYDKHKNVLIQDYSNVESCIADNRYTVDECTAAINEAKAIHDKARPQFADKADCEKDFGAGQCEETSRSMFGPFFVGYMMGRHWGANSPLSQPFYKTAGGMTTVNGATMPANARTADRQGFADARNASSHFYGTGRSSIIRSGMGSTGRSLGRVG